MPVPGKTNCRGRLSTVDLFALTSLDQLLLLLKTLFTFLQNNAQMRRSTVLSLSLQLVFPCLCHLESLQIMVSLTDDSRGVIYDRNTFIVQATGII